MGTSAAGTSCSDVGFPYEQFAGSHRLVWCVRTIGRNTMTELPAWIRQQRKDQGLSQTALASRIELPAYKVSQWERGVASPDAAELRMLEKVLGSRPSDITSGDDRPTWWAEAIRLKDRMTLRDLADHLGISVGMLTSEMKKAGVTRRVRVATAADDGTGTSAPTTGPVGSDPDRRSGSKDSQIEQFFHLLGKVPDSEVARLGEVSVRTVASYRARNGIPGYQGPRRRPQPRGKRQSKLEDFVHLLGKLPDRVVAEEAGMSLGAVRNFRVKNDIPAAGRMPRAEIQQMLNELRKTLGYEPAPAPALPPEVQAVVDESLPPEPGEPATPVVVSPAPAAKTATKPVAAAKAAAPLTGASSLRAWRVVIAAAEGERKVIVVAEHLVAAVQRAVVAAGGDDDAVIGLESLGQVLTAE